jgi:hypothetical protein
VTLLFGSLGHASTRTLERQVARLDFDALAITLGKDKAITFLMALIGRWQFISERFLDHWPNDACQACCRQELARGFKETAAGPRILFR